MDYAKYLIVILFSIIATTGYAMNRACLSECFETGHDCLYCAYECDYSKFHNPYRYSKEICEINWDEAE